VVEGLVRATKEETVRGLRKKGDGRWHEVVERRAHFNEHKIRRQGSDAMSAMMLLGEQVESATTE
jgi:hypothetical protein